MYTHTHTRAGTHAQTNAYRYNQRQLRHNTTGRKETAADVNTVCRGGLWSCLCRMVDKGTAWQRCPLFGFIKNPASVVSLLISASSWKEQETEDAGSGKYLHSHNTIYLKIKDKIKTTVLRRRLIKLQNDIMAAVMSALTEKKAVISQSKVLPTELSSHWYGELRQRLTLATAEMGGKTVSSGSNMHKQRNVVS